MYFPLVMLAVLILLIGLALVALAREILKPPRMSDGKAAYLLKRLSPGDLGMQFQEQKFAVRDERSGKMLTMASWWIPNPSGGDKTVILIHGYADAKVGSIAWAPTWQQLGYHILAIDLRAHGESQGDYTTAGVFESCDLDQIINELRTSRPVHTRQIVLFGVSLGALVALATAHLRSDIAAVVLDSPVASFRDGVEAQMRLLSLPLPSMLPIALWIAKRLSGANFDRIKPLELMATLKSPLLIILSGEDHFVTPQQASQIEAAIKSRHSSLAPAECLVVPNAAHLMALAVDPSEYRQQLDRFLRKVGDRVA